jgi:hypothetical protein
MSRENILQPIQIAMDNYKELAITPINDEDNRVEDLQYRLNNLLTSETRNYFLNLFMPDQNQQFSTNELDIYFDSNSPSLDIVPLEW